MNRLMLFCFVWILPIMVYYIRKSKMLEDRYVKTLPTILTNVGIFYSLIQLCLKNLLVVYNFLDYDYKLVKIPIFIHCEQKMHKK